MKPRALYHLMLIRARKLREEATADVVEMMDAISATLTTDHNKTEYTVGWTWQGASHSITVPDKDFSFHVAGDTPQAVERRDNTRNYRQENWDRARQLWQQIGTISGLTLVPNSASDVMGLQPAFTAKSTRSNMKILAAMALGAGLISGIHLGWVAFIVTALTAILLFTLWDMLTDTHLRAPLSTPFAAVLAAGAALPSFWGASTWPAFIILFAAVAACWVERQSYQGCYRKWALAGLAASLPIAVYGMLGAGVLLLLLVGMIAATILVPSRYIANFDRAYAVGAVTGGAIFMFLGAAIAPEPSVHQDLLSLQYVLGFALALISALWWFHGTMSAFLAWWMLFLLGAVCLLFAMMGVVVPALLAFTGLAVAAGYEIVRAYRMSWIADRPIT